MAMTADVLPTRASILDTTVTTRLAVKMAIPETPVLAGGHDGDGGHDRDGHDGRLFWSQFDKDVYSLFL
jgi:hypothetical protein